MQRFEAELYKVHSSLGWNYHVKVNDDIAREFIDDDNRRVVCTINGTRKIHTALMPDGTGHWFIFMNQKVRSELKAQPGDRLQIVLEKDRSEYGTEMPVELSELLRQDEEGSQFFHQLTPGKQRTLIYIVSKVKNTNSRLNKALAIVDHLKDARGKLDFKALNEKIKYYNNL